ncbi:Endonuclease/exonuclease/phosphatase [Umbelopsis sp. AD052]|nr:Endonuclease/exonuclease/phosphatase [Umbelopsis sp. AD052]
MAPQLRACRPISVPNTRPSKLSFTLISYNILAQALIKRELFPHSGNILKWKTRKAMILKELKEFNADILCLQEVDHVEDFYGDALLALGYSFEFCKHPTKLHGCLIAFKHSLFTKVKYDTVDYDTYPLCPPTQKTGNIAQLIALKAVDHDEGILVGNTHLYWRPQSFYERLRQGCLYVKSASESLLSVKNHHSEIRWSYVLAGDLNTTPTDPTYPSLTGNPLNPIQEAWLEWSRREITEGEEMIEGDPDITAPPPKPSNIDDTKLATVDELRKIVASHSDLQSVYNRYGEIDAEDIQQYGEPKFTHYGTYFKGTLDYIFLPANGNLECRGLSPLPKEAEMEPGLPNAVFGSDHVPLCCQLHLLE